MFKWIRRIVITCVVLGITGGIVVGTGLGSYVRSSGKMLKSVVKDSVPIEFEIQRAKDSLEGLVPAAQEALRDVAREEVEVASLEREIVNERDLIAPEVTKIQKLRDTLKTQLSAYPIGGREYRRQELVEELSRRLDGLKTAEMLLLGKEDLLRNRRRALDAAVQKLEKTRFARLELASQIESLEAQYRLIEAQATGTHFHLDDSKLSQSQSIIADLKKRLAVAQRVLAREAQFIEAIPVNAPNESTVIESVDTYLQRRAEPAPPAKDLVAESRI